MKRPNLHHCWVPLALTLTSSLAAAQGNVDGVKVPFERIVNAGREPGSWLTYSRDYSGARYSPLSEITASNVQNLRIKWMYQFPDAGNEVSPLVVDGIMYVTGPNTASALDARTGRVLWNWKRPIPADFHALGFGHVNRGGAVLGSNLYVGTLDGYLVALDLKSGAERWASQVADYHVGYSITGAPLALENKVITGVSGGEGGVRGLIDAYDAESGKRVWRFWTIPGPDDQRAFHTWAGDSAQTGGGPTWVTGAYDPELKLLYWGIGNPSPDWNGDARAGDNLYTDSVVALDTETGRLRWHFQFTAHDTHDWDACHVPVLFDGTAGGHRRKLLANANRNGFYYVLDRESGAFVTGQAYSKQTWSKGLDAKGRAMVQPHTDPTLEGTLVWPNMNGATLWFSPSYSPATELMYVPVRIKGARYFKRAMDFKPGIFYPGGGEDELSALEASGEIRAVHATTGAVAWRFPLLTPASSGVLSTAGNLVLSGTDEGNVFALDAMSGKPLWDFEAGSAVEANPISYELDNHQYIAISADRVLLVFGL